MFFKKKKHLQSKRVLQFGFYITYIYVVVEATMNMALKNDHLDVSASSK